MNITEEMGGFLGWVLGRRADPPPVEVRAHPSRSPSLYPRSFAEFVGQEEMKTLLRTEVESAKREGRTLSHILLAGPPGVGKTAVAHVLAGEMGYGLFESTGAEYQDQKAMLLGADQVTALHQRTGRPVVWLLDEIDGVARAAAYALFGLMTHGYATWEGQRLYEGLPLSILGTTNYLCHAVGSKILTADLRWVPVETLKVGDELVGIDEYPVPHKEAGRKAHHRQIRRTTVEATQAFEDECYRIVTERGSTIVNGRHLFLSYGEDTNHGLRWTPVIDLKPGCRVKFLVAPWEEESGDTWLAGIADGEGCLSYGRSAIVRTSFAQNPGPQLDRIGRELTRRGFDFRVASANSNSKALSYEIRGGLAEALRFLGSVRPSRLLDKWQSVLDGGVGRPHDNSWTTILQIDAVGPQPMVSLQTSSRTYIGDGFISHNSLVPRALKSRFGEVVGLDYYSPSELALIAKQSARRMGFELTDEAAEFIGENAAGEPRRVNVRILRNVRNLLEGVRTADLSVARRALKLSGLRHRGLSPQQFRYLEFLASSPKGKAGLNSVAAFLATDARECQFEHEPFLLRSRYVQIVPGGREIRPEGLTYLEEAKR